MGSFRVTGRGQTPWKRQIRGGLQNMLRDAARGRLGKGPPEGLQNATSGGPSLAL
jgi:hypothetical protein